MASLTAAWKRQQEQRGTRVGSVTSPGTQVSLGHTASSEHRKESRDKELGECFGKWEMGSPSPSASMGSR